MRRSYWMRAARDVLLQEVEAGSADYAVVPVENSTEGAVNYTLDLMLATPLRICGEVELRIHDHLMSQATALADIKRVYSHGQSLAQCRECGARCFPERAACRDGSGPGALR